MAGGQPTPAQQWRFAGERGTIVVREWPPAVSVPRYFAVLVHGYGEHIGRYEHVAAHLQRHGAAVCGPDHMGHGRSAGDRVLITDYEEVVADLHHVVERVRAERPTTPVVLIGHSMGGMIAARYAQEHGRQLAVLVLSGPVLGSWREATSLLGYDEIPHTPIDVSTLSRDPEVGRAYAEDPLVWHGPFLRPTLEALERCLTAINTGGRLGGLPTLWVHGADDQLVPIAATRAGIENIRGSHFSEKVYAGARHEVFNETNNDEVLDDVTTFIERSLG